MSIDLRLGDCLEIMRGMPAASVDAVITDPPYGIDYQSAWRTDKTQWKPKIANDKMPFIEWLPEAFRLVKDGGALVCFHRWDVAETFKQEIERVGFVVKSQIIWDKVIHGMGDLNGQYAPRHECAWFATKGKFNWWATRPQSIIRITRVDAEKLIHPNEKPIPLFVRLIESIVDPKGKILDPFVGSGASMVAASKLYRDAIGIEINPQYFEIAQRRIAEAQAQMTLNFAEATA